MVSSVFRVLRFETNGKLLTQIFFMLNTYIIIYYSVKIPSRLSNTVSNVVVEKSRTSRLSRTRLEEEQQVPELTAPRDYKYVLKPHSITCFCLSIIIVLMRST